MKVVLFQLFSNSCFGKFIENRRLHLECVIAKDRCKFEKLVANPRYSNFKILSQDGIVAVFLKQRTLHMSQAWAIGFTILERSKGLIYSDYYERIKPALGEKCAVLFTDTDSLCLRVTGKLTKDQVLDKLADVMDYSNYPKDHPRYSQARQNQLRYWKDEMKGSNLVEFVGLASKTYSMRISTDGVESTQSKCKGVGKGFRKRIPFPDYKKCVVGINSHRVNQYSIQSRDHIIRTMKFDRLCFSSFGK